MRKIGLIFIVLLLVAVFSASAEVISLEPDRDAFVCDCDPGATNPFAGDQFLAQGRISACYHRTFISWDLSSLPENIKITEAEFRMYCAQRDGSPSGEMYYYRVLENWNENTVTWGNKPDYTEDGGITLTEWPSANSWHTVDVTDFTINWYNETTDNYGLYCTAWLCTSINDCLFYSSRVSVPAYRPKLVITYTTGADLEAATWGEVKVNN